MIHAIVTTWALDEAKKRKALPDRCPQCGGEKTASEKKASEPVFCEKCETRIHAVHNCELRSERDRAQRRVKRRRT